MINDLQGKSVPWPLIEACLTVLNTEQNNLHALVALKNNGTLPVNTLENLAIQPMYLIYEAVAKLLRDNNIIKTESEEGKVKMECALTAIMKLQDAFLRQNKLNQFDIKSNIKHAMNDIDISVGATISEEIEKCLMSMAGILGENFG